MRRHYLTRVRSQGELMEKNGMSNEEISHDGSRALWNGLGISDQPWDRG